MCICVWVDDGRHFFILFSLLPCPLFVDRRELRRHISLAFLRDRNLEIGVFLRILLRDWFRGHQICCSVFFCFFLVFASAAFWMGWFGWFCYDLVWLARFWSWLVFCAMAYFYFLGVFLVLHFCRHDVFIPWVLLVAEEEEKVVVVVGWCDNYRERMGYDLPV